MRRNPQARQQFFYPPFSRIIRITFKHKLRNIVQDAASLFALHLHKDFGKFIYGTRRAGHRPDPQSIYHGADA